jgi:hypothetical protein
LLREGLVIILRAEETIVMTAMIAMTVMTVTTEMIVTIIVRVRSLS